MAGHASSTGRLPQATLSGRLISPVEIRRQNNVLRRLIEHVRTYSPEVDLESNAGEEDELVPPISHRRPVMERGQLE